MMFGRQCMPAIGRHQRAPVRAERGVGRRVGEELRRDGAGKGMHGLYLLCQWQ
jgi:hypothetical protein